MIGVKGEVIVERGRLKTACCVYPSVTVNAHMLLCPVVVVVVVKDRVETGLGDGASHTFFLRVVV